MSEDLFDKLGEKLFLTKSSVFSFLDEYTVYSYYIEQAIGPVPVKVMDNFRSPLRKDDTNPSFRLFYGANGELLFTDYGNKNQTGDVVKFVQLLMGVSYREALRIIAVDFGLKDGQVSCIPVRQPVIKPKKELKVVTKNFNPEELAFWKSFYITPLTLKRYDVHAIEWILWENSIMKPKTLTFGYRMGRYWKLYSPYDKKHKFVSYFPGEYVEGFLQLRQLSDLLIITKSTKDVMVLAELGYEGISPQSESYVISEFIRTKIEVMYKHIIVLFDNDGKGVADQYPYPSIELPGVEKDISDFVKAHGMLEGKKVLKKLLNQWI